MYKAKRVKRDTVENLYRQCQITGTCPPDVVNKVEQTTLADILLKIFGSVIYLGGLGIGSGSGAGATGLRPVPENIPLETLPTAESEAPVIETPVVRPRRPPDTFGTRIDPISSAGNRPRPVDPRGPAIVPLNEGGLPDPGAGITDYEVLTTVDTFEDTATVNGHPTVLHGQEEIAILEVTPPDPIYTRIAIENPRDTVYTVIESAQPLPESLNIFVDPNYSGVHVGEEIELETINTIAEFEIEEDVPKTSTPVRVLESAVGRARRLYNRFVEQVATRNEDFLGQPSRAILFEFENPAFEDDVTLTFERDLQELATAPDPAFSDVIQLERPIFSETKEGLVRFSRLGTKGKISTRSGSILRQKVHFYYDISPISKATEAIELQPIVDSSDNVTIVDGLSQSTFVNPVFEDILDEEALLEDTAYSFAESHLTLLNDEEAENVLIPTLVTDTIPKLFSGDYFSTFSVIGGETQPEIPLEINPFNITPAIQIDALGSDFYLHPALMKRRKRKYSEIF